MENSFYKAVDHGGLPDPFLEAKAIKIVRIQNTFQKFHTGGNWKEKSHRKSKLQFTVTVHQLCDYATRQTGITKAYTMSSFEPFLYNTHVFTMFLYIINCV